MSSSRAGLKKKPSTRSGSREVAFSVENPYKPGFIDPSSLESFRMGVDAELSAVSNAFYQQAEVTSNLNFDEEVDEIYDDLEILEQEIIRIETETEAGFAAIQGELVIMGDQDELLAQALLDLEVVVDSNTAAISNESTVRASEDAALAQQISTLSVTVGENTAAISNEASVRASADGELYAQWGVKMDVNGHVSGVKMNNDGAQSEFIIVADTFKITDSSGSQTSTPPFEVVNGSTRIKSAYVNTIQSDNWDGGANGWFISNTGDANFQNVTVNGTINASTSFKGIGASGNTISFYNAEYQGQAQYGEFTINSPLEEDCLLISTIPLQFREKFSDTTFYITIKKEATAGGQVIGSNSRVLGEGVFEGEATVVGNLSKGFSGKLEVWGEASAVNGITWISYPSMVGAWFLVRKI